MAMKKRPRKTVKKAAKAAARKPAKKQLNPEDMQALWQKASTPAAGHAPLQALVGTWSAKTTFTMGPGVPDQVHGGTSVNRMVLGGRFLEQTYKGTAMGMPFEGIGFTGYDNVRKKYVGSWMDTMGTGIMTSLGTGKPSAARSASVAESYEPSGKKIMWDTILKVLDRDHHTFEMWTKAPNGKKYRAMFVEYARA
jgi:hypothetical protein